MSEYTPTDGDVRARYTYRASEPLDAVNGELEAREAEFDRWLAEHDREVAAAERERCAHIAEGMHDIPVGADTNGNVTYQSTARFPDDGRRVAAAIREGRS